VRAARSLSSVSRSAGSRVVSPTMILLVFLPRAAAPDPTAQAGRTSA
jgi:hypothetical protein